MSKTTPKQKHALIVVGVIVVVFIVTPAAYIIAALVGGVVLVAGLPALAKHFKPEDKNNDETP